MDRRVKNILGIFKTKESVNTDTYINIPFNGSTRLLPPDEMNRVLDIGVQFNKERQNSPYYRISGKLNVLASNVLFNTTGTQYCWEIFSQRAFTGTSKDLDKDLTYVESIKKNLKEIDGWYGYFDPILTATSLCSYFDMEPRRERFSFIPDTISKKNEQIKNWELTITYPYSSDKQHTLINGGILLAHKTSVTVGGKDMVAIGVPIKHNLNSGNLVRLSGTTIDGDYEVKRVGLDNGDLKEYYFCIDIEPNTLSLGPSSRMTKIYKGIPCEYYFRKFKKIKTKSAAIIESDDYEIFKLAFSENVYDDPITQFLFNEDIDVSNLVDNLNRPLSQIYLTVIKTDSSGIFTNIQSGIEAPHIPELMDTFTNPYFLNIPIIQGIHGVPPSSAITTSYRPLEPMVLINNNDYYGDVVEYNISKLEETTLSDVYHRFNTINRETTQNVIVSGPRPEGYMYQSHYPMQIRDFSIYIEQGDIHTAGIPDYAVDLGNGRYIWRDLLDIGRTDIKADTVNYPFVNGCHYLYQNYCFDVRRQDPFDNWNIYHGGFPPDPIGNTMTIKFKLNASENVC